MTPIDLKTSAELRHFLTSQEPLGPSNSEEIDGLGLAASALFERQNQLFQQSLGKSGILVGRRGSGKTAFLKQLHSDAEGRYRVFLQAHDVFPQLFKTIRSILPSSGVIVETVGALWDRLIWICIFKALADSLIGADARAQTLRDYLHSLGVKQSDSPEDVIEATLRKIKSSIGGRDANLEIDSERTLNAALTSDGRKYTSTLITAKEMLDAHKAFASSPVLVLMDTLEEYKHDIDGSEPAISGLLRYLGKRSSTTSYIDLRFCLPAELYHLFKAISSNPEKDFVSETILQWHAGDLLKIVAHRLILYLALKNNEMAERLGDRFDLNDRKDALEFLEQFLPESVRGSGGQPERPIGYILRHTQLLPRQVIQIFNNVLSSIASENGFGRERATEQSVINAAQGGARTALSGISKAFRYSYPHLEVICEETLIELPLRFKESELHTVFTQHGGGVLKKLRNQGKTDADMTFTDFKRMLIEVGAVGREIDDTQSYWEAEYEYSLTRKLITSENEYLCMHPIFSVAFPNRLIALSSAKRIYPYGSNPLLDNRRL